MSRNRVCVCMCVYVCMYVCMPYGLLDVSAFAHEAVLYALL